LPALASDGQPPSLLSWLDEALQSQGEESIPAYSPVELLTQKDFSTFTGNDLDEVSRLVVAIARRVATRLSRRVRAVRRGHALDLRRTIRHSLRRGGEIVELAYRKRRIQKTRVVLLADVSGSMDLYSRFLIQFIFALQHALGQVETLVFSTTLTRVTEALSASDLRAALDQVARTVPDWSGGTKIGQSLRAFLTRYGGLLPPPGTVVIVISDGWDAGDNGRRALLHLAAPGRPAAADPQPGDGRQHQRRMPGRRCDGRRRRGDDQRAGAPGDL